MTARTTHTLRQGLLLLACASFAWARPAAALDGGNVDIHGFVTQAASRSVNNGLDGISTDGGFAFNSFGINFNARLADNLRAGLQVTAYRFGQTGDDLPMIDWALLDYRFSSYLGIRAGKIKSPFLMYSDTADLDAARTPILLPTSVYSPRQRDTMLATTGFGAYGSAELGNAGNLEYELTWGSHRLPANGGSLQALSQGLGGSFTSGDISNEFLGRIDYRPTPSIRASVSGVKATELKVRGPMSAAFAAIYQGAGLPVPALFEPSLADLLQGAAGLEVGLGTLKLTAEGTMLNYTMKLGLPGIPDTEVRSAGWYAMASYELTGWLTSSLYYSDSAADRNDWSGSAYARKTGKPAWTRYTRDVALSLRFDLTPNLLAKAEAHVLRGTQLADAGSTDKNWGMGIVQLTAVF